MLVRVKLHIKKNLVYIPKNQEYQDFVRTYLIKYEEVKRVDPYSFGGRKRFISVRERRNLYEDFDKFIVFSRGLLEMIPNNSYQVLSEDPETIVTPKVDFEKIRKSLNSFDLRDDQVVAVGKCIFAKRGVIQLPTATGKSAIIASTIKSILEFNPDTKILVLSPTLSTVKSINKTFTDNGINSEVFGYPNKFINSSVTSSLVQSLISHSKDDENFLDEIGAVFYDECFPSKAKVTLPDGRQKTILEIYNDDSIQEVLSYDLKNDQYVIRKILRKFKTPYNDYFWKVYYKNPLTEKLEGVSLTPNHKVYSVRRGCFVEARELTPEDIIKVNLPLKSGNYLPTCLPVFRVSPNIGKVSAYKYNLEIEDTHNYFVNNVLVSNCHHLKCETWNKLNRLLKNVEYSIGFSALSIPKEEIYKHNLKDLSFESSQIVGCSGKVIMHMDYSYYIEKGIIARPAVLRINNQVNLPAGLDESNWQAVLKYGLMSTPRTSKIAEVTSMFNKYGRKVLILVPEKDYAFVLCRLLVLKGITRFGISFGAKKGFVFKNSYYDSDGDFKVDYSKEDSLDVIDQLGDGKIDVLIATSHTDEGVDIPGLDACILAGGGKKDRKIIQRVGRVLRKSKTGKFAYIVDFTDSGSAVLSRHSRSRLSMYKDLMHIPSDTIFDGISLDQSENIFKELEGLS